MSIFFKYTSIKSWSGLCKSKTLNSSSIGYNTSQLRIVGTKNKSEAWLQQAVAVIGPIAVSFIYKSGVYFESDCGRSNPDYIGGHAAVVVGFGTDANYGDYWILKNSWSGSWGEKGYVHFARNKGNL